MSILRYIWLAAFFALAAFFYFTYQGDLVSGGVDFTILLVGVGVVAVILNTLISWIFNPKSAIKGIILLVALAGIIFLVKSMASGKLTGPFLTDKYSYLTENTMQWVETGVNGSLLLIGVGIVAIVLLEIINIFR